MMWGTIANLKENLHRIALDVHDDDDTDDDEEEDNNDDLQIYASSVNGGGEASPAKDSPVSARRNSRRFAALSSSPSSLRSPVANGGGDGVSREIEQYRAEIKRVQDSEAEIKALAKNYAALLKEKEDQISRLSRENGSLKQNLDTTTASLNASRIEIHKAAANENNLNKGGTNLSPNRQQRSAGQAKTSYSGHHRQNGINHTQDGNGMINGIAHISDMQGNERELADSPGLEMKDLQMELKKEQNQLKDVRRKLLEEQKLNATIQEELKILKLDREKTSSETSKIQNELNDKMSEINRLQIELNRRDDVNAENFKRSIATLEKENNRLKMEKIELEAALRTRTTPADKEASNPSGSFPGKEEMELSLNKINNELNVARRERDKALQELKRLKQHLLEKESEESEKMDEDSKVIEELRQDNEHLRSQIFHMEKALKKAIASQEDVKMFNNNELQKSKQLIDDLNKRLESSMSTIDAKNMELLNLQTALGQYYAEIEAKEHLEGYLARAREESARLSQLLKDADHQAEVSKAEKEEILSKLSQAEKIVLDWKGRVNKLEEDNSKLRRAVEQSMTRLNRMSIDSDFLVDRRIVIKLLVTYFQRNHSKEVLDLMTRMLGFTDDDKQRIGVAQGGKGVVRGVLGLPGRLVGGILGGNSTGGSANAAASDDHSFADLWVDFLLKETEEREKNESADDSGRSQGDASKRNPSEPGYKPSTTGTATDFSRGNLSPFQNSNLPPFRNNFRQQEPSDSEFSTVPLTTSSENNSYASRQLPRY